MDRRYKRGVPRGQQDLFPMSMEESIDRNHPIRALDAYVNSLDLDQLGFRHARAGKSKRGHPAYPPGALLKLYLYGYLNRIKSSRQLERECRRNLEVIWLLESLAPSYKTIADFRSQNAKALRKTLAAFIEMCRQLSLFEGSCVAIDGSFFQGNVSDGSFTTTKGLKKGIEKLEDHIAKWQQELAETDYQEASLKSDFCEDIAEKLEAIKQLQEKKQEKEAKLAEMKRTGKTQVSRTDADARLLSKGGKKTTGYNAQIATESRHHLIVAAEVTSAPNDSSQLHSMAVKAKAALDVEALDVVADSGYYSAAQLADCLDSGITPYVPAPDYTAPRKRQERFTPEQFDYDSSHDTYRCPAGVLLRKSGKPRQQSGQQVQRYAASESDCKACPLKSQCTTAKSSCREIWRSEHHQVVQEHEKRMADATAKLRLRKSVVEHPFGTMKERAGWSHFLLRGREKVSAEFSLMVLCYNFTRLLNIVGTKALIAMFIAIFAELLAIIGRSKRTSQSYGPVECRHTAVPSGCP